MKALVMKMLAYIIEQKRKQMISTANVYGLSSKQAINCSKELDELINLYQRMNEKKAKRPAS
jgi:hypothetical protein